MKASDALVSIFKKYIDEAEQKLIQGDSEKELSAFQKLLKIDKYLAMTMTMDMLQAGIDTVIVIFTPLEFYCTLLKLPSILNHLHRNLNEFQTLKSFRVS